MSENKGQNGAAAVETPKREMPKRDAKGHFLKKDGSAATPKKAKVTNAGKSELPKSEPGKPHIGEVVLGIPNDLIEEVAKNICIAMDATRSLGEKFGYKRGLVCGIAWGLLASGLIDLAVAAIIHFTK